MKNIILVVVVVLTAPSLQAQDIVGQWNGILKVQGTQLTLVLHVEKKENGYSSKLDSPDQGARGIPVASTRFENSELQLDIPSIGARYSGKLNTEGIFDGTFTQAGQSFPLQFSQKEVKREKPVRPQEPQPPYPYYAEEVTFSNPAANITLAGTLTLPAKEGKFPVVVLISGSGPQNRDEEVMTHRPFLVLADHLTRKGIGVLRYDDRGTAKSTGDFKDATSVDFASDTESAVKYLMTRKEVDSKKIGLVGHSEGGLIAPMVAVDSKDVGYIVMLAGPGISGRDILPLQTYLINVAGGKKESEAELEREFLRGALDVIAKSTDINEAKDALKKYLEEGIQKNPEMIPKGMTAEQVISAQVDRMVTPWMRYFLAYDPAVSLSKLNCPVLAINGEKDLQVPPKENLGAIEKYLKQAGNKKFKVKEMSGLNHLFQECTTGSPGEYALIEQTFAPAALEEISGWILGQVGGKK